VEKDPQVAWNRMIMDVVHPQAGPVRLLAHPVRYDGQVPALRRLPPAVGEHSREVLAEYGFSGEHIERLVAEGVVMSGAQPRSERDAAD